MHEILDSGNNTLRAGVFFFDAICLIRAETSCRRRGGGAIDGDDGTVECRAFARAFRHWTLCVFPA